MKTCNKCKELKPFAEFNKGKSSKDGHQYSCRVCQAEAAKTDRQLNPEKYKIRKRKSYDKNPKAHSEKSNECARKRREAFPELVRERGRKNRKIHSERRNARRRATRGVCEKNKKDSDIGYRLRCNLRSRTSIALRNKQKTGSAVQDLGCTGQYLADYLETLFAEGMSWENYGNKEGNWNIDHIAPLSAFNLEDRQHFLLANHYLNLQPMWHVENMSKNDTLPWELEDAA